MVFGSGINFYLKLVATHKIFLLTIVRFLAGAFFKKYKQYSQQKGVLCIGELLEIKTRVLMNVFEE